MHNLGLKIIFIATFLSIGSANSQTVTLNTAFGIAFEADGTSPVPDNTLWAMIVDDGDDVMPGGLEINTSLQATQDESSVDADFGGKTLDIGTTINGDTIFAMGGFNGSSSFSTQGFNSDEIGLTLGINGVDSGEDFGFYWFPGVDYADGATLIPGLDSYQVGGISESTGIDSPDPQGMIIPSAGSTINTGATTSGAEGSVPDSRFTAITIPEPSSHLLLLSGIVLLLTRRKR